MPGSKQVSKSVSAGALIRGTVLHVEWVSNLPCPPSSNRCTHHLVCDRVTNMVDRVYSDNSGGSVCAAMFVLSTDFPVRFWQVPDPYSHILKLARNRLHCESRTKISRDCRCQCTHRALLGEQVHTS